MIPSDLLNRSALKKLVKESLPRPALKRLQQIRAIDPERFLKENLPRPLSNELNRLQTQIARRWLKNVEPEFLNAIEKSDFPKPLKTELIQTAHRQRGSVLISSELPQIQTDFLMVHLGLYPDMIKDLVQIQRAYPDSKDAILIYAQTDTSDEFCRRFAKEIHRVSNLVNLWRTLKQSQARVVLCKNSAPYHHQAVTQFIFGPKVVTRFGGSAYFSMDPEYQIIEDAIIMGTSGRFITMFGPESAQWIESRLPNKARGLDYPPGCMNEWNPDSLQKKYSQDSNEIHLVFAQKIPPRPTAASGVTIARTVYKKFESVVQQGLHLHVHTPLLIPGHFDERFEPYYALAEKYPEYFHIEPELPYDELLKVLPKYDLAFCHHDRDDQLRPEFSDLMTNGFLTFIQAGLPLVVSHQTFSERVARQNIGISLHRDQLSELKTKLTEEKIGVWAKNVRKLRKQYELRPEPLREFFNPII